MAVRPGMRRGVVAVLLMAGFGVVLSRLISLQVLQAADLSVRAERQHRKVVTVEGSRGTIFDRKGKVLAMNVEVPSVFGVPTQLKNRSKVARELARVLDLRTGEVRKKLEQERGFVWVARKVDPEKGRKIRRLSFAGVGVILEGRRYYPKGPMLSHVLGFAGVDNQGLEGLELQYEQYLRGKKEMVELQRDALGRAVLPKEPSALGSAAGHNVKLTIDEVIQYVAEKELEVAVNDTRAKRGTLIVMEPRTGALLAMAVHPRFDPNAMRHLSPGRWRNRAVTDVYEPGSTMKIFLAAAALEEKVMSPRSLVYAENGRMKVANTVIHDHQKSGWITFSQVIQRSSNIGAVKTAMAVGGERLYRYFRAFGFGDRTEIDLPGESAGLVKGPREWGRRTLASMAIGQEIGVTPIQLAAAAGAVANGGWLMKPYIVSEIRDTRGDVVFRATPQVRRRPVSAQTLEHLRRMLERAVTSGTGSRAALPQYRVAGKTGTAQKFDRKTNAYSDTRFVGSFVGYVPAKNPRLTILVIIDEPQTESWGGIVAAPVFRRVAEQALPHLGVPVRGPVEVALDASGTRNAKAF